MFDFTYSCGIIDEWEELCIVAVEQSVAEALETELFRDLMTSLGLTPPTDQVTSMYYFKH